MSAILADGHVHLHEVFDVRRMLAAARARSVSLSAPLMLLLAECSGSHYFETLSRCANGEAASDGGLPANLSGEVIASLGLEPTGEATSLRVNLAPVPGAEGGGGTLYLVAGRQFISVERLEILGLFLEPDCDTSKIEDGTLPADALILRILDAGAAAVLPWGVGKWLGSRREVALSLAESWAQEPSSRFFLGDIAHRCWPWPTPRPFRVPGARVLPGTDLLPIQGTEERLARYGFCVNGVLDEQKPAASFLEILSDGRDVAPVGTRERVWSVLREQLAYRMR